MPRHVVSPVLGHLRASLSPLWSRPCGTASAPAASTALFTQQSPRRVFGSPVLPLDSVALPSTMQARISALLASSALTPRRVRRSLRPLDRLVAPEAAHHRRKPLRGAPVVAAPPAYAPEEALAHAIARAPGTLAANVYVMAEIRRRLRAPFEPRAVLDFGAGVGVATMAVARVFNDRPFVNLHAYLRDGERNRGEQAEGEAEADADAEVETESVGEAKEVGEGNGIGTSFVQSAALVDRSSTMRDMAKEVLEVDKYVGGRVRLSHASELGDLKGERKQWDMVVASYVLNEVVRGAMATPALGGEDGNRVSIPAEERERSAEKRLRRTIKDLWNRTEDGGLLVVVEDGTAAGFETVSFVRRVVLEVAGRGGASGEQGGVEGKKESGAAVIAPCLHSKACPLDGSITRRRVCRFQQRFNRPAFLRKYRPMATAYEDEYFSYIAIQKIAQDGEAVEMVVRNEEEEPWGRLVRPPLMKGKHVVMDACTVDGALERRVVSKRNAAPGQYSQARRAKWGDIWPVKPRSGSQTLHF